MSEKRNKIGNFIPAAGFMLITLLSGLFSFLYSQQPSNINPASTTPTSSTTAVGENGADGNSDVMSLQDFNPISLTDARFSVGRVNFDRRYASTGTGEFLDIVFDINNLTNEVINLQAFVIAFNETDAVDRRTRSLIPYPTWRFNDPAQSQFLIHYMTITPDIRNNIPSNETEIPCSENCIRGFNDLDIWNVNDPDYKAYKSIIERMQNAVASSEPIQFVHPPLWKLLNYITNNPTKGLKFTLYGERGPGQDRVIDTNYISPSPQQKKLKINPNLPRHKYTLEFNRQMTVFRSHHFSRYRANFMFFNTVAIILFDADKAKVYEEKMKPVMEKRRELHRLREAYLKRLNEFENRDGNRTEQTPEVISLEVEATQIRRKENEIREMQAEIPDPLSFKRIFRLETPLRQL